MNAKTQLVFVIAAGCLWLAPHGLALGQGKTATTGATVQDAPGSTAEQPAGEQEQAGEDSAIPIFKITSVELMRSTHAPELERHESGSQRDQQRGERQLAEDERLDEVAIEER